jgi:hypothetical protein
MSHLSRDLPGDGDDGGVAELEDPVHLGVHDVHGSLRDQTGALRLQPTPLTFFFVTDDATK